MFNQYIFILVWIGFMALLQGSFYREEYNELVGDYEWRVKPIFAFMVMIPVIWMVTTRGNDFGDTIVYRENYQLMPSSLSGIPDYLINIKKDYGFRILSIIIKCIVGNSDITYFFILALIQVLCLIKVYRKYSSNYIASIGLFILSTDYVAWMFNGIRQFIAATLIFSATSLMLKKKYVSLIIIILVASTMHQSALLMIPIIFIAQGKAWNKKTIILIAAVIAAIVFLDQFTEILDDALSQTQYVNVVSDYKSFNDDGTNPLRVLIYSLPTLIAFYKRKEMQTYNDKIIDFCVNMSIVSTSLYIISMFTSGIYIGRLPIYASLYGYILLPWEIDNLFGESNSKLIKVCTVIGYLLFYYFQIHLTWGLF